jgi:siroheme synthase
MNANKVLKSIQGKTANEYDDGGHLTTAALLAESQHAGLILKALEQAHRNGMTQIVNALDGSLKNQNRTIEALQSLDDDWGKSLTIPME